jgi:hypothetical protein
MRGEGKRFPDYRLVKIGSKQLPAHVGKCPEKEKNDEE